VRRSSGLAGVSALALTVAPSACGSSSSKASPRPTVSTVKPVPAGIDPSESAQKAETAVAVGATIMGCWTGA
jgi:hypothetical protein